MSHSLIALVGRPNVGKSTLFNRIIGQRQAIVDDEPGVTRDRHYARTDWAGKPFTVVDTGGFVPESEDVIETAIREQAEIAIDESDLVLFVVDAHSGVHPMDGAIAGTLRKTEKPVIVVVNKVDSESREGVLGEFYELGLGDPVPVAALVGRGIGDLLDLVTRDLHAESQEKPDPRLKIAIVGKPNVGKSSLVNALIKENRHIVTDIPGTTRDAIDATLTYHGEEIVLVDTAGLRRKTKIKESIEFYSAVRTLKAIERCDVAVILIDARDGLQHQDLRIVEMALSRRCPLVLAVNKWDLIEKDDQTARWCEQSLRQRLRVYDFLPVVFVSALKHQRIYKILDLAKTVDSEQNKHIGTSELNDLLGRDMKAFPPRSKSGEEVKIKYITQVKAKPPVFAFFCNNPTLVVDSYRRYLENKIREHFGFIGVPVLLVFKRK